MVQQTEKKVGDLNPRVMSNAQPILKPDRFVPYFTFSSFPLPQTLIKNKYWAGKVNKHVIFSLYYQTSVFLSFLFFFCWFSAEAHLHIYNNMHTRITRMTKRLKRERVKWQTLKKKKMGLQKKQTKQQPSCCLVQNDTENTLDRYSTARSHFSFNTRTNSADATF